MSNIWVKVAGLSGASAVLLGAVGAHALLKSDENMKETWKTAAQYHLIHTVALGVSALHFTGRKRTYVCALFASGMLFFSGACYGIVLMNQRKPLNQLAPVGGILMTCGWLAFALL
mmetsp:Transcript_420/g.463  ORF Transcript_420/g.463 Transcript_420/m.463 type:complete len:116 (+) Transcript_420:14-361(+)